MTTEPWLSLPKQLTAAEVGYGEQIAQGGSSSVFSMLGDRKSLLYKKYLEPRHKAGIERLVDGYAELGADQSAFVRAHLAWPLTAVSLGDDLIGVIVVRARSDFYFELPTGRMRVRDLNYLLYEKRAERLGIERATDRQKVTLLAKLAEVLLWLDEHEFVHEDLAAHNVLWSLNPPEVFLLDCDSVRPLMMRSDQPLYTTVDWTDPRVLTKEVARPDRTSTSYVLGLLAARVLISPNWHPRDALPSDRCPPVLASVIARATGPDDGRPSFTEWVRALDRALPQTQGAVMEPEAVDDPAVLRKGDKASFVAGLVLGACVAVFVLVRFL